MATTAASAPTPPAVPVEAPQDISWIVGFDAKKAEKETTGTNTADGVRLRFKVYLQTSGYKLKSGRAYDPEKDYICAVSEGGNTAISREQFYGKDGVLNKKGEIILGEELGDAFTSSWNIYELDQAKIAAKFGTDARQNITAKDAKQEDSQP